MTPIEPAATVDESGHPLFYALSNDHPSLGVIGEFEYELCLMHNAAHFWARYPLQQWLEVDARTTGTLFDEFHLVPVPLGAVKATEFHA